MVEGHAARCIAVIGLGCVSGGFAQERPNILWLTSEDNNVNWVGCYGNRFAETPNIDKLASDGFQYMHCYANAPVCAPSRSTWITGMYAISLGTHPMRSRYGIPHDKIKYYPDYLKKAGYYVGNAKKTDYNIGGRPDNDCWDTMELNWRKLKDNQPFFMVINNGKSHESRAFGDVNHTEHNPDNVRLAKYHPNLPGIRKNYALYHDKVKSMDADIGKALKKLDELGLAENTIVIYNSDHGGVMPRSKRFLYESGLHAPFIMRIPQKFKKLWPGVSPGAKVESMVSFIDMPKTWLSICGAEIPAAMQGKIFLGPDAENRSLSFGFRGRMDERIDNVRAVHDGKFLYIRNYMPYVPCGQHLIYMWKMVATQAWDAYNKAGKTDAVTGRFFRPRVSEELYNTEVDPDNINNLANNPEYTVVMKRMRAAMTDWQRANYDAGMLPETEVVRRAEKNKMTIYEMVRRPDLYNLDAYLRLSELALQRNPENMAIFMDELKSKDSGDRYWAVVGLFMLAEEGVDLAAIKGLLGDSSHHVRVMAAWLLYRSGDKADAVECWKELLRTHSYASLMVLNVIDWQGDGIGPYADVIRNVRGNNERRIGKYLLSTLPEVKSGK